MSTVEVEKYRGFSILFNTDSAKFYSAISDVNSKESSSFLSVRKYIDDFKKDNQSFTSFWIIPNPERGFKNDRILVTGMRKDGRLVGENGNKEAVQISIYDEESYVLEKAENEQVLQKLKEIDEKRAEYEIHCRAVKKDLLASVNLITLKKFKESELLA